jgi:hypothetical protein
MLNDFSHIAMNVLRMVKMFGWEKRINERVAEKREEELNYVWKRQLLDLTNGIIKYVVTITWMQT